MNQLSLRYEHDASYSESSLERDDFGRLSVTVETDQFSGRGGFWVQWQDVIEFGQSLSIYPVKIDEPLMAQWGYDDQRADNLIIRIKIAPKNSLGELVADIEIADENERWKRVRTSFRTGYPALEMFQRDIARLMAGEAEVAVLIGH